MRGTRIPPRCVNSRGHGTTGRSPAMQRKYTLRSSLSLLDRFWEKVDHPDEGCWTWLGARNLRGYGVIGFPGRRNMLAHRAAYVLLVGPIPDGLFVLHKCDNPACVRPDHLRLGNHTENMAEMRERGRSLIGNRNSSRRHPERLQRGDDHWTRRRPELLTPFTHAKVRLTREQVAAIRARYAAGGVSQRTLAQEYGVSRSTIADIVAGRIWKP